MSEKWFRKWIRIGIMGLFIGLLTAGTVLAATKSDDEDYYASLTGPGVAVSSAAEAVAPETIYNKEMGMYEHEFAGGRRIVCSVANGGQVSDAVYVSVPRDATVELELEGQPHPFENGGLLYHPGYYVMVVTAKEIGSNQNASAILRFRILNPPNGKTDTGEYPYPKVVSGLEKTTEKSGDLTLFVLPNNKGFLTDVPEDGASVTDATFYFPPNIGYQIYKDGMPIALYNNKALRDSGRYQLKVYADSQAREGDYAAYYEAFLNFMIPTNADELAAMEAAAAVASGEQVTYQPDVLDEIYHEELGLYEEVFENGNVFYSNVGNGAIVGGGAYLDIPQNITVKMAVDGVDRPYLNKAVYDEEGTYYFTLSYQEQTNGAKTIYQSNFRFRIQKNAPLAQSAAEIPAVEAGEMMTGENVPPVDAQTAGGEEEGMQNPADQGRTAGENPAAKDTAAANPADQAASAVSAAVETKPAPDGQGFDHSQQLYYYTFSDGSKFFIGVPQNGISNTPVLVMLPTGGRGKVTMGENSIDLPESVSVNEDGHYHIEVTSAGGETATWDFVVMGHAVSDLAQIQAPEGYYISSIVKDGVPVEGVEAAETYDLKADGSYTVSFLSYYEDYPEWFLAAALDTQAPTLQFVGVDAEGKATGETVEYITAEDGVTVTVMKGKKEVKTSGNIIKGSGTYVVTAADPAGNQTSYEVKIPFKADKMTVLLIVVVWILAVGFVVYYKFNAKKFKVR